MEKSDSWETLRQEILKCQRCPLARTRSQAVPGEGSPKTLLVIIGEAPGRQEDLQGRPFVGAAGQLLTKLLGSIGITRDSVFITNVVKCRPPENRQPSVAERKTCISYLTRQLEHINPKIIALVGRVAAETLLDMPVQMGSMHGKIYHRDGRTFFIMYHPAAGLYNQNLIPSMEEDMQRLKRLLADKKDDNVEQEKGQLPLSKFFEDKKKQ